MHNVFDASNPHVCTIKLIAWLLQEAQLSHRDRTTLYVSLFLSMAAQPYDKSHEFQKTCIGWTTLKPLSVIKMALFDISGL